MRVPPFLLVHLCESYNFGQKEAAMFKVYIRTVEGWNIQSYSTMPVARFAARLAWRNEWLAFIVIERVGA